MFTVTAPPSVELSPGRAIAVLDGVWRKRITAVLPYVLTVIVIAVLLQKYSFSAIVAALKKGDVAILVPLALTKMLVSLALIAVSDRIVISQMFRRRPRITEVAIAKAASSLLDIVGYAVGHGSYGLWIARHCAKDDEDAGVRSTSVLLYLMAADLAAVCIVASVAIWGLAGGEGPPGVRIVAPIVGGLLVLFMMTGPSQLLGPQPKVLSAWGVVSRPAALAALGLRLTQMVLFGFFVWAAAQAFGMDLPLRAAMTYTPIILLVGALPINVAGFGAVQAAWLLLTPWASSEEQVLAFQFAWQMCVTLSVVARGLPFLRRWTKELVPSVRPPTDQRADQGAKIQGEPDGEPSV